MSTQGFWIHSLLVVGPGKEPAEVQFGSGLNVISGPSDTGKSYIYGLIDFMLGGSTIPEKDVRESKGYETAFMSLYAIAEGTYYTLERSLTGGDFKLFDGLAPDLRTMRPLLREHAAGREDTISAFLLRLTGLPNAMVLRRMKPPIEVGALSFREVVHCVLAAEERVYTKESPIHQRGGFSKTPESSVFRMLLTGVDDSALATIGAPPLTKAQKQSQVMLLAQMVGRMEQQLSDERRRTEALPGLAALDRELAAAMTVRDQHQQTLDEQEKERQQLWRAQKRLESEMIVEEQTLARFRLLEEHYRSDLKRLEAISEAEHAFAHLAVEACPMCGSPTEAHNHENISPGYAVEDIQEASQREAQKVHRLLADLTKTVAEQQLAYEALVPKHQALKEQVFEVAMRIEKELAPQARVSNGAIVKLVDQRASYSRLEVLESQLGALREQHAVAVVQAKARVLKQTTVSTDPGGVVIDGFCLATQDVLEAWRYRGSGRVTFDKKVEDIEVGGLARKSHGKGIRAILYAAFLFGLMRYCLRNERPHPGIAVIDSPLVAFRPADDPEDADMPGDELPVEFKRSFYEALANGVAVGQVIIFENEDPPPELHPAITYTHFTKSSMGRYGFFPRMP